MGKIDKNPHMKETFVNNQLFYLRLLMIGVQPISIGINMIINDRMNGVCIPSPTP